MAMDGFFPSSGNRARLHHAGNGVGAVEGERPDQGIHSHRVHDGVHHGDIFDGEILGELRRMNGLADAPEMISFGTPNGSSFMAGRAMRAPVIPEMARIP